MALIASPAVRPWGTKSALSENTCNVLAVPTPLSSGNPPFNPLPRKPRSKLTVREPPAAWIPPFIALNSPSSSSPSPAAKEMLPASDATAYEPILEFSMKSSFFIAPDTSIFEPEELTI